MKRFPVMLLASAVLIGSFSARALTVLQLNLEQLTALSEKVFAGRCLSVVYERDPSGRPVQTVTFEATQILKGEPEQRITFRQLRSLRSIDELGETKDGLRITGLERDLPQYEVGEEAVIFLSAEGGLGLTAPVGLAQGKFAVIDRGGAKVVINGLSNRGLFVGANKSPKFKTLSLTDRQKEILKSNGGEIGYDDFVSLVTRLATR